MAKSPASAPAFYECDCGFFHPAGFTGDCDDKANRYDLEQLDEDFPDWTEVAPENPHADKPPNLSRLLQLTAATDLNHNKLEVGCKVRVYVSGFYVTATDTLDGISLTDTSGSIIDGTLEQIGTIRERDGAPCYVIKTETEDYPQTDTRLFNQTGEHKVIGRHRGRRHSDDVTLWIEVNGHETHRCAYWDNHKWLIVDPDQTCPSFVVFRM